MVTELHLRTVRKKAIEVDFDQEVVRLKYFVYPRSFLDIKQKASVVIPFDEILTIQVVLNPKGMWNHVFVYTSNSRFSFSDYFKDHDRLVAILEKIASGTKPAPLYRNQMALGFVAGVLGLGIVFLIGWLLGWI